MHSRTALLVTAALACLTLGSPRLQAQSAAPAAYLTPPKAIVDILDAEPLPTVVVSPARDTIALMSRASMPSIAGSVAADAAAGRHADQPAQRTARTARRPAPASRCARSRPAPSARLPCPPNARLGFVSFSPDGKRFFFTNTTRRRASICYVGEVATGADAHRADAALNG